MDLSTKKSNFNENILHCKILCDVRYKVIKKYKRKSLKDFGKMRLNEIPLLNFNTVILDSGWNTNILILILEFNTKVFKNRSCTIQFVIIIRVYRDFLRDCNILRIC